MRLNLGFGHVFADLRVRGHSSLTPPFNYYEARVRGAYASQAPAYHKGAGALLLRAVQRPVDISIPLSSRYTQ